MKASPLLLALTTTAAFSQGSLTPPGAPGLTQKSLEEIWGRIGVLKAQNTQLEAQNLLLQKQIHTAGAHDAISTTGLALPWILSTVDSEGDVGLNSSLAYGPDGHPAIAYFDGNLKMARFNGSAWVITIVDSASPLGLSASLAFGPDGQPAISYHDYGNSRLKFARFNGSSWTVVIVDDPLNTDVGQYSSLAFGPDGQPAISFHDESNGDLILTRYNGTSWISATVDNELILDIAVDAGEHTSLAFGQDGQPAISYSANGNLKFARFNGSVWTLSYVTGGGSGGTENSLEFGPDGQPAISCLDSTNKDLKFARFNGSTWSIATVDAVGLTGYYTSLAFGPDGHPAISYYDVTNGDLKIARKGVFEPVP